MSYQPSIRPVNTTSSLAIVSLVFAVLAWCVLPVIGAVVAIICGHLARGEIRRSPVDRPLDGDGMAIAGLVLGYVQLALTLIAILLFAVVIFGVFGHAWH